MDLEATIGGDRVKPGDLVTLMPAWSSFTIFNHPGGTFDDQVDLLWKGEVHVVLEVDHTHVKVLSPRGKAGWIWKPRVEVVK